MERAIFVSFHCSHVGSYYLYAGGPPFQWKHCMFEMELCISTLILDIDVLCVLVCVASVQVEF